MAPYTAIFGELSANEKTALYLLLFILAPWSAPGDFREGRDFITFLTSLTVNGSVFAGQAGSLSTSSFSHGGGGGSFSEKSEVLEHFLK